MAGENESVNEQGPQPREEVQHEQVERQETQQQEENRIPQSRVEEMITRRLEKERQSWEQQHLEPERQKFRQLQDQQTKAEIARMTAMGWITPEAPKPVTQEMLDSRFSAMQKQFEQKATEQIYAQRITGGWREVSRTHTALSKVKSFQNAVLAAYAEQPQRDFVEVANEVANEYEGFYAARSNEMAARKTEQLRPDRRVVPSGRGAGGGSGGNQEGNKKQSVAEKIRSKLSERE